MTLPKTSSFILYGLSAVAVSLLFWVLWPGQQIAKSGGEVIGTPGDDRSQTGQGAEVTKALEAELEAVRADAWEKEEKVRKLERQLTSADAQGAPSKPPEWLRDPEMIKVFKSEAASAATRSAKALMDAGLGQQLGLNEEQSEALEKLLIERSSALWNHLLLPLTVGGLDQAGRAAASKAMKDALERNVTEIKALVGDDGFKTFEWFEKTQPDRDTVKQFTPRFSQAGFDLNAEQQTHLLAVMTEERTNFRFKHEFGDPMKIDYENWDDNFTEDKVKVHFQEMEQLNERIIQRAQLLLTPEQITLLRELHADQLRRSMFTVRNTKAMLGQKR